MVHHILGSILRLFIQFSTFLCTLSTGLATPLAFILIIYLLISHMFLPALRGFLSRNSEDSSSQDTSVSDTGASASDTGTHRQGEGRSTSPVRSAPRRGSSHPSSRLVTDRGYGTSPPLSTGTSGSSSGKQPETRFSLSTTSISPPDVVHSITRQPLEERVLCESPIEERDTAVHPPGRAFISDMPTEILKMIFIFAFPQSTLPERFTVLPLPLLRVCKRWKSIVEETPEFWRTLYPSLEATDNNNGLDWYRRMTTDLLKRVVAFHHVVIELPQDQARIYRGLLQHLLNLASRSAALKLSAPSQLLREIGNVVPSTLLDVPTHRRPSDGIVMEHLKTLDWEMLSHHFGMQFPSALNLPWTSLRRFPWAQLTDITLTLSMTLEDFGFILDNSSVVEKLSLKLVSGEPLSIPPHAVERKSLPRLHSLTIGTEVSITPLLQHFDMPELCKLDLHLLGTATVLDLPRLNVPWRRLTHFALNSSLPTEVLETVLGRFDPNVILELVLGGCVPDGNTWTPAKPVVLNSLRSFIAKTGGVPLMSRFVRHILPYSIKNLTGPVIPTVLQKFESLRAVEITHAISPNDLLAILTHATSLEDGKFEIEDAPDTLSNSDSTSSVPTPHSKSTPSASPPLMKTKSSVTHLKLHLNFQNNSAKALLDALTLPRLISLNIQASKQSSDCRNLYALLERSRCRLLTLSVNCAAIPDAGAVRLLRLLSPTLEELTLETPVTADDAGLGKDFCQGLTHGNVGHCLCPRLKHLNLWPCRDPHSFYEMVRSRLKLGGVCSCGLTNLERVTAGLPDSDLNCSDFERTLRVAGIRSDLQGSVFGRFIEIVD